MEIPKGMAMAPLTVDDLCDFAYNYFKAEYAPLRSIFSTASAKPRSAGRWIDLGNELEPKTVRPAKAQAQRDIECLDQLVRTHNLDAVFLRGLIVGIARAYRNTMSEQHERLDKKLLEAGRVDLLVRKALKEKQLLDALWPSMANLSREKSQQALKVRGWYQDMLCKYFLYLRGVDDFKLRREIVERVKTVRELMLIPHTEHLVFGAVTAIEPISARTFDPARRSGRGGGGGGGGGGERSKAITASSRNPAERLEVHVDNPSNLLETQTHTSTERLECSNCGIRRDVTVTVVTPPPYTPPASAAPHLHPDPDAKPPRHHTPNTSIARSSAAIPATPDRASHPFPATPPLTPASHTRGPSTTYPHGARKSSATTAASTSFAATSASVPTRKPLAAATSSSSSSSSNPSPNVATAAAATAADHQQPSPSSPQHPTNSNSNSNRLSTMIHLLTGSIPSIPSISGIAGVGAGTTTTTSPSTAIPPPAPTPPEEQQQEMIERRRAVSSASDGDADADANARSESPPPLRTTGAEPPEETSVWDHAGGAVGIVDVADDHHNQHDEAADDDEDTRRPIHLAADLDAEARRAAEAWLLPD